MKTFLPKSAFLTIVFFIANLVFASTAFGQVTVTTDQPDYAPGSTCTITGSGFLPGETVTLQVMHADETPNDGEEHFHWDVITDENGNFVTTWHVCEDDCLGSTLKATADGQTSGLHAEVIFTDGNVRVKSSTSTASIFWSDLPSTDCTGVPISSATGTATTNSGLTFSKLNTNTLKSLRIEAPLQAANGYYFSSWSGPAGAYTVDGSNPRVICVPGTNSNGIQDFTISYVACSPPTITGQPNAAVISYGSNSSFTVVAAGTTPLTYQWQENAGSGFVNISNGGVYSNTTEATLTLTKPTVEMSGRTYRCIVTGACLPTTISNGVATLTVNPVELIPHITANDKPYDGGTSATLSAQWVTGMVNNETDVTLIVGAKSFDNANTGARTVTASSLTLGGTKAGNYVLAVSATAADDAAITAVELIPHITANDKPYDGGTNATLSAQWVTGMVNNETDVTLIVGAKSFDNANTGARTVTASSLTLGGTEAGNYVLAVSATATDDAAITAVELIPHITANDKPYDGGTSATLSAQWVTGMVNNETDVTLIVGDKSFDNANIGTRTVTASSLTLGGTKASNYVLAVSATATDDAAITAVELIPHITANDKPYDGGTSATLSAQWVTGMVNNETDVTLIVGDKSFNNANIGTRTVTASSLTLGGTKAGNYVLAVSATATDDAAITAVELIPHITANDKPYDGGTSATLSAQWVTGMVNNETDVTLIVGAKSFDNANIGIRTVTASSLTLGGTKAGNYVLAVSATATDDAAIMALPITITANPQSKYCGQNDPEFTYEISSGTLVPGDGFTGSLSRELGESVGSSPILQGSLTLGDNYDITYVGAALSITGVSLDASGSSFTVQMGGTTTTLKAFVTASPNGNSANNVNVSFKVFDGINQIVASGSAISGVNGVNGEASLDINISSLPIGLYRVEAVAGLACSSSTGYMTIYDPNGSFITGGGWITSPAGAYAADQSLTGKANFGFVSKYKKGSNLVDGNTEFQFNAGNFNFKSNSLDTGTLVISGAKATYRGVGTVNGSGNYGFMVSAIDGQITGGGGIDKFRIKIWDIATGNTVVYDNQIGSADNVDAITALGGGSIVIHEVKKKTTKVSTLAEKTVEPILFNIKAYPNPSNQYFTLELEGASNEKVEIVVYDVLGRLVKHIEKNDVQPISFGEDFPNGVYIAITSQGVNRKTQRLIKQ